MTPYELDSIDGILNLLGYFIVEEDEHQKRYRNETTLKKWTINVDNKYRDTLKSILLIELMQ